MEPGECGAPHVTDSFGGDGGPREGGGVAAVGAG